MWQKILLHVVILFAACHPIVSVLDVCTEPPAKKRVFQSLTRGMEKCFIQLHNPANIDSSCIGELMKLSTLQSKEIDMYDVANAADLILSRAGIFNWNRYNLEDVYVCKEHHSRLFSIFEIYRRRSTHYNKRNLLCGFPAMLGVNEEDRHVQFGDNRVASYGQFMTKVQSEFIWEMNQILVPVGTALCKIHHRYIEDKLALKRVNDIGYETRAAATSSKDRYKSCASDASTTEDGTVVEEIVSSIQDSMDTDFVEASEEMKDNIRRFAKAVGVERVQFTQAFLELSESSQRKRASTLTRIYDAIAIALAPDAPDQLKRLAEKRDSDIFGRSDTKKLEEITSIIADALMSAPSTNAKYQTLSIIAPSFSYNELVHYIPTLSLYSYKRARQYAEMYGGGTTVEQENRNKERFDGKKVESFISFITSPHVVTDLPFGVAKVKRSSGVKEEIPNLIRHMVDEHTIDQYLEVLKENGDEALALSRSTLIRILKACSASTRKTMQGLDYFTFAGTEGFEALIDMSQKLKVEDEWKKSVQSRLQMSKQFLKKDYRLLVQPKSNVPEFCMSLALSDCDDDSLSQRCTTTDHSHDGICPQCHGMRSVMDEIKTRILTASLGQLERDSMMYDWKTSYDDIIEWKKHILRSVNQENARHDIIKGLRSNEAFVQIDWAMKWLPAASREDQTSFFGKRGVPWHIAVVFTKAKQGDLLYQMHTYVHVFEQTSQDSEAVIAIIRDVMQRLHDVKPPILTAYIRSDNAGCYHGSQTIAAIPQIERHTGIHIARWDFSDPQAGKGPCDRAAANIKRQIRMYIAEGNACRNAAEFISCATNHRRVKYTTFIHSTIQSPSNFLKTTIPKISLYNNFEFSVEKITAWRAYKIGPGVEINKRYWEESRQSITKIIAINHLDIKLKNANDMLNNIRTWKQINLNKEKPETEHLPEEDIELQHERNVIANPNSDHLQQPSTLKTLFTCPTEGCKKVFRFERNLDNHIFWGKHDFRSEKISLMDTAINSYKVHIERMQLFQDTPHLKQSLIALTTLVGVQKSTHRLDPGWAFRSTRPAVQFSKKQRVFLLAKFQEGVDTRRKKDPSEVAKEMRVESQFNKDEWLTGQQIKSFFSREAQRRRTEIPEINLLGDQTEKIDIEEEQFFDDPYVAADEDEIMDAIANNDIFLPR